jgi:hypothetical protein
MRASRRPARIRAGPAHASGARRECTGIGLVLGRRLIAGRLVAVLAARFVTARGLVPLRGLITGR